MIKLILSLIFTPVYADSGDWVCKSQSILLKGDSYLICGRGSTREEAFENAIFQFEKMCRVNDYCDARKVRVEPKRIDCYGDEGERTCVWAVVYTPKVKLSTSEVLDVPDNKPESKPLKLSVGYNTSSDRLTNLNKNSLVLGISYCFSICIFGEGSSGSFTDGEYEYGSVFGFNTGLGMEKNYTFAKLGYGQDHTHYDGYIPFKREYVNMELGLETPTLGNHLTFSIGVEAKLYFKNQAIKSTIDNSLSIDANFRW